MQCLLRNIGQFKPEGPFSFACQSREVEGPLLLNCHFWNAKYWSNGRLVYSHSSSHSGSVGLLVRSVICRSLQRAGIKTILHILTDADIQTPLHITWWLFLMEIIPLCDIIEVYINIYLRLYTTIFHNSEKLQVLFSAWRHVSAREWFLTHVLWDRHTIQQSRN